MLAEKRELRKRQGRGDATRERLQSDHGGHEDAEDPSATAKRRRIEDDRHAAVHPASPRVVLAIDSDEEDEDEEDEGGSRVTTIVLSDSDEGDVEEGEERTHARSPSSRS